MMALYEAAGPGTRRIKTDGATNDKGYVYCIAEYENGKETGYFKIGTAYDPEKRLQDLQTGNVRLLQIWKDCQRLVSKRLDAEGTAHTASKSEKYDVKIGGGTEGAREQAGEVL